MSFDHLQDVNYLAVLVAAIAWFIFGAIWYIAFAKQWQRALGVEVPQGERPSPVPFVISLLAYIVTGIATAALAIATGTDTAAEGAVLGLLIGVGFLLPGVAVVAAYERKPEPGMYFVINGVYNVLAAIVVAVIIAVMQ